MNRNTISRRNKAIVIIVFTYILLCAQSAFSQVDIDSLWNVWNDPNQPDTIRLEAMQKIAWDGHLFSQPDSAFYYAQLAYDFAKSKGLKEWMARALNIQGRSFFQQGDYDSAIDYFTRYLTINEEIGHSRGIATSLNSIGIIYNIQGNYTIAIDYYKRSLTIKEEIGDKNGISKTLNNIGNIYRSQGDYASSIDYYTRSLSIKEEIGDKQGIASSLNNIGLIYFDQGDNARAIDYYTRSLAIQEEIGDKLGISTALNNIGNILVNQKDYDSAIYYHTHSLTICEEIGDKYGIASSLNNIGNIYSDQGDHARAIDYYTRSLVINEEIEAKAGIATSLNNLGNISNNQGDSALSAGNTSLSADKYASAIAYSTRALITAQEVGAVDEISFAANVLYKAYKSTGKKKSALEMYELYIATRDSINSEENQKEVIRQKYKYDYEKQAIADSVTYVQVQKVQEAQLEKSRILQFSLLGGVGLLVVFLIYVFNRFWVTRKQKLLISEQNKELTIATEKAESANSELKTKSEELEKFNDVMLDREMRIIELKEEVNSMSKDNNTDIPYPEVEDE